MAQKQPCAKYQYVLTSRGPKILPVPDQPSKDEEAIQDYNIGGYLPVKVKDSFKDGRYLVLRKLGWGHFSTVWLVRDNIEKRHSALKVVKSAGRYAETARDEIKLLRKVMDANPAHPGRNHVVSFLDSFQHCAPDNIHVCLVFEPLGENLLAVIERHKATGVPVPLVKVITKQVLLGLQYLHDECDLVHTDIKPENIMISIPDVESHIQAELSISPPPTSRKVNVPPKHVRRPGVIIPRRLATGRERHVHIFNSQPLSSPLHSASSSPNTKPRLQMSRIHSTQSVLNAAAKGLQHKQEQRSGMGLGLGLGDSTPELSDTSSGPSSITVSTSFATASSSRVVDTPPTATSLGSLMNGMKGLSVMSSSEAGKTCTCLQQQQQQQQDKEEEDGSSGETTQPPSPPLVNQRQQHTLPMKPSLLSQTAPSDIHDRRLGSSHDPSCPASSSSSSSSSLSSSSSPSSSTSSCPAPSLPHPTPSSSSIHSPPAPPPCPITIKIADLGNATPSHKHYTEEIQTRQYRSPEAILGRTDWSHTADIWSLGCVIFELLTAEYLFDPQSQGDLFGKDDDHMAQIIELVGDFEGEVKWGGRYSREIFDSSGSLRYIRSLKPWPLKRVMVEKYLWTREASIGLCEFLEPMLRVDHRERKQARELVEHEWLEVEGEVEGEGVSWV